AEHRSKRARHPLVFNKTAASTSRIDQTSRIEGVSCLAIIGQSILQQQRVLAPDLMVQSSRSFGLCARHLKLCGVNCASCNSRERAGPEGVVDRACD